MVQYILHAHRVRAHAQYVACWTATCNKVLRMSQFPSHVPSRPVCPLRCILSCLALKCVSSACQVRASLKQLLPLGLVLAGLVFVLCAEFRRANRWLRPQTVVGSVGSNKACNCGDKPNGLASASARTRLAPRLAPWLAPQLAPWLAPWQAPWRSTPGSACGRLPSPPLCAALSESDLDLAVPAVDNLPTAAWKEVRS